VERNGLRAIAFGHGRDQTLDLPFLPANVDIRRGDVLVTSGIDGVYPAGLKVASVTQVKISPDSPFARIVCAPAGGVENHRHVLLVSLAHNEVWTGDEVVATGKPLTKTTQAKPKPTPNNLSRIHAPQ
jgi:rod shape-determining protein MreC